MSKDFEHMKTLFTLPEFYSRKLPYFVRPVLTGVSEMHISSEELTIDIDAIRNNYKMFKCLCF